MKGEQLIIQLLRVKEQYKYKQCYTGEVNIPHMIDDVVSEINRLTSKNAHDEHYIELGKAVEKAFEEHDYLDAVKCFEKEEGQIERYVDEEKTHQFDSIEDLFEWAEGRE